MIGLPKVGFSGVGMSAATNADIFVGPFSLVVRAVSFTCGVPPMVVAFH
jgi:hypothetical protein